MLISVGKFFLDPFNLLWILAFSSLLTWYLEKIKLLKWLLGILAAFFLVISTPLLPETIIHSLESRYKPLYIENIDDTDAKFHIIVLGGGHALDDRLPPNSLLSRNALGRLNEGIRLYRQLPNSKLVLSGFSASGRTTQAEMLQKTALLLGVDKESTIVQNEPKNTWEEAKIYAEEYASLHPVILVTSAAHMERAVMVFKKFGIDPLPSPTNFRIKGSNGQKWFDLPSVDNIIKMRMGLYEYAGLLQYKFLK